MSGSNPDLLNGLVGCLVLSLVGLSALLMLGSVVVAGEVVLQALER